MFVAKDEMARLSANGLSVSRTREGHIELGTEGLRLKITGNPSGGFGYVSLGMVPSLTREGVIGLALALQGNKGQGFAELDTADGPVSFR
jgi:hypothetical protein